MPTIFNPDLNDMRFVLNEVLNISQLSKLEAFEHVADVDIINDSLDNAAKIAKDVLHPLNVIGDKVGCTYDPVTKSVTTPPGFKEAYKKFRKADLTSFSCSPEYDGLGMPIVLNTALSEMISSANLSFGLYPGLMHGVYTAMEATASQELKDRYLPKLVSGELGATMCLTEPQAGTDLGLINTKAVKQEDGTYKLTGTKIFISAGDHDLTDNILHLVLARIEDPSTPGGIKGISLFAVPKLDKDGKGNGVAAGRIEEKMGLHGNATCEMNFDGAVGELVGEPNKGMRNMFVMMNEERLLVGVQGLGMSEVAYQNAVQYAQERDQSVPIDQDRKDQTRAKIIAHPDVRRELLTIRAAVEGGRMLAYWTAMQLDIANKSPDAVEAKKAKNLVDLLTPIVKAHLTDNAEANTSSAMQVFGGHGYIVENGMEQFSRDARITRLYEGTNGIQALDLLGLKVMTKNLLPEYLAQLETDLKDAKARGVAEEFTRPVEEAAEKLKAATTKLQAKAGVNLQEMLLDVGGVSTDYLKLASLVTMGHMWVKMVDTAQQRLAQSPEEAAFYQTKIDTGRFYMEKVMPQYKTLADTIDSGATSLMAIANENFAPPRRSTIGLKPYAQQTANINKPSGTAPKAA